MHTSTILSSFLVSAVLAVPHVQYRYGPNGGPASIPHIDPVPSSTSFDQISASETLRSTTEITVTTTLDTLTSSSAFSSIDNSTTPAAPTAIKTPLETSSPVSAPTSTSTPLPQAGVYICEDVNWGGKCTHMFSNPTSAPQDCVQLDGTASSIGPDRGFDCYFFTNSYCRPLLSDGLDVIQLFYPGEENMLETYNGDMNDKIYSYFCLPEGDDGGWWSQGKRK